MYPKIVQVGAKDEKYFTKCAKNRFRKLPREPHTLNPVLSIFCSEKFLGQILNNNELRKILKSEPDIMMRFLEINAGIEFAEQNDSDIESGETLEAHSNS